MREALDAEALHFNKLPLILTLLGPDHTLSMPGDSAKAHCELRWEGFTVCLLSGNVGRSTGVFCVLTRKVNDRGILGLSGRVEGRNIFSIRERGYYSISNQITF